MFLLFAVLSSSYYMSARLQQSTIRFPTYGFKKNGSFRFYFNFSSTYSLQSFFLNRKEFLNLDIGRNYNPCIKPPFFISELNRTILETNDTFFEWNGNVAKKDVYTAIFLLCRPLQSSYSVDFQFFNPDSYLDYRSENLPIVYLVFSFLNCIVSCIWFGNIIYQRKFDIKLPFILAIPPLLRAVDLVATLRYHNKQVISEIIPLSYTIITSITFALDWGSLLSSVLWASSGYCTIRKSLPVKEIVSNTLIPFLLATCMTVSSAANNPVSVLTGSFLTVVFILLYLRSILIYYLSLFEIDTSELTDETAIKKVQLVWNYVTCTLTAAGCTTFLFPFAHSENIGKEVARAIFEVAIFIEAVFAMYFFLLRDSYSGEDGNQNTGTDDIVLLEEPKSTELNVLHLQNE